MEGYSDWFRNTVTNFTVIMFLHQQNEIITELCYCPFLAYYFVNWIT